MKEIIFHDLAWMEDSDGFAIIINNINRYTASGILKVYLQSQHSTAWVEVTQMPQVSADGYTYSVSRGLTIYYFGVDAGDTPHVKIVY